MKITKPSMLIVALILLLSTSVVVQAQGNSCFGLSHPDGRGNTGTVAAAHHCDTNSDDNETNNSASNNETVTNDTTAPEASNNNNGQHGNPNGHGANPDNPSVNPVPGGPRPPTGAGCHGLANALVSLASAVPGHDAVWEQFVRHGCFIDSDNDTIQDSDDNCPLTPNLDQADWNNNGIGDVCDDSDADTIFDSADNCLLTPNTNQADWNQDGEGDACDDSDADTIFDSADNCLLTPNTNQADWNQDGEGDACDDSDADTILDDTDNCVTTANMNQADLDEDGVGDACDDDIDGDGALNVDDCAPLNPAIYPGAEEILGDGIDNNCDGFVDFIPTEGDIEVTLFWTGPADLDIHVIDPNGERIWWNHKTAASGGELEKDIIPSCGSGLNTPHAEHAFWPTGEAIAGTYHVYVDYWNDCGVVVEWHLIVEVNGSIVIDETSTEDMVPGLTTGDTDPPTHTFDFTVTL